jgi:hypothetical protein
VVDESVEVLRIKLKCDPSPPAGHLLRQVDDTANDLLRQVTERTPIVVFCPNYLVNCWEEARNRNPEGDVSLAAVSDGLS